MDFTSEADRLLDKHMVKQKSLGIPRQYSEGFQDGVLEALTNPEFIKAQGLYTQKEVDNLTTSRSL